MKILKKIFIGLLVLVALVLIVAAFLPSETRLERSIVINKPVDSVYIQVADFNNFRHWNPWSQMDTASKNWVTGTPGQLGSEWHWEGKKVGTGIMRLDSAEVNKQLKTSLIFKKPMEGDAKAEFKFDDVNGQTKVTWAFQGHADYPLGRIFGAFFMQNALGKQFDQGLTSLKKLSESK